MLFSTIECYLLKFIKTTSHFRDLCHKNGYIKHKNSKKTATTILNNVIAVECFIFCYVIAVFYAKFSKQWRVNDTNHQIIMLF